MPETGTKNYIKMTETFLVLAYRVAVKNRCKRQMLVKVPDGIAEDVARELGDMKLVNLFIKSQFHSMPIEFCKKHFKRIYPPASVCFGGNCWERYENYINRGINDGS